LLGFGFEPFLQRLVEAFHFAAGGGVVRPGMLLGYAEPAEFGLKPLMVSRPAWPPAKRVVNTKLECLTASRRECPDQRRLS